MKGNLNVCVCVFPFGVWIGLWVRTLTSLSCQCVTERISCGQVVYLQLCECVWGMRPTPDPCWWPVRWGVGAPGLWLPLMCDGWCMASSQAPALICRYCNCPQVSVVFSLFATGLNGKHVEKLAVLLEGRKINREERLPSSLCTPPSSMRCQEKFRSVTQRRRGSSVHINTLATPPHRSAHTWFSFVGSEVRIIIIGCTWGRRRERKAETEDRTADSPEFRTPPPPPPWLFLSVLEL